jgi:hypothetical protein
MTIFMLSQLLICFSTWSIETCSRTAVINFQEVLVDTNSTQKGEGLRYYLEKDSVAKEYLNRYQKGTETRMINAIIGTTGSLMALSPLFLDMSPNSRRSLLIGGGAVIAINFLVAKTLEYQNEENLHKAIKEYNKRNGPKILFSPILKEKRAITNRPGFFINFSQSF